MASRVRGSPHGSWHVDDMDMDMAWARIRSVRMEARQAEAETGRGLGACCRARELKAYLVQERKQTGVCVKVDAGSRDGVIGEEGYLVRVEAGGRR